MCKLILTLTIMTLIITTTVGLAQLSLVFAAPPQGENPHGDFGSASSSGNPHSPQGTQKGNHHLCETIEPRDSQSSGGGAGKTVIKLC